MGKCLLVCQVVSVWLLVRFIFIMFMWFDSWFLFCLICLSGCGLVCIVSGRVVNREIIYR